ncbi:MAG: hypothetical protein JEZ07_12405 [Phycisphaerae bacterium]|nr:hypothetical protein [Phycisphaerae bacterium]
MKYLVILLSFGVLLAGFGLILQNEKQESEDAHLLLSFNLAAHRQFDNDIVDLALKQKDDIIKIDDNIVGRWIEIEPATIGGFDDLVVRDKEGIQQVLMACSGTGVVDDVQKMGIKTKKPALSDFAFELSADGSDSLAVMTTENVGRRILITLGDLVFLAPAIESRVEGINVNIGKGNVIKKLDSVYVNEYEWKAVGELGVFGKKCSDVLPEEGVLYSRSKNVIIELHIAADASKENTLIENAIKCLGNEVAYGDTVVARWVEIVPEMDVDLDNLIIRDKDGVKQVLLLIGEFDISGDDIDKLGWVMRYGEGKVLEVELFSNCVDKMMKLSGNNKERELAIQVNDKIVFVATIKSILTNVFVIGAEFDDESLAKIIRGSFSWESFVISKKE